MAKKNIPISDLKEIAQFYAIVKAYFKLEKLIKQK